MHRKLYVFKIKILRSVISRYLHSAHTMNLDKYVIFSTMYMSYYKIMIKIPNALLLNKSVLLSAVYATLQRTEFA